MTTAAPEGTRAAAGATKGTLRILSGGAANGLVMRILPRFTNETGHGLTGDYGAVGGMVDRVVAGEQVDILILTAANIAGLQASGHVLSESVRDIGVVETGVAVNHGEPIPDIADSAALRTAFAGATALYVPDTRQSTAGRHVASILSALGMAEAMAPRLREFPNGMTAMRQMAEDALPGAMGCTQVTEILSTTGVDLVGLLPGEHALSTTYTAAVSVNAAYPEAAAALIAILTDPDEARARRDSGFS